MLYNLSAEMVRHNVKMKDIEDVIGKKHRTVRDKINGTASFTIAEAQKIKHQFFPAMTLDYLFSEDVQSTEN